MAPRALYRAGTVFADPIDPTALFIVAAREYHSRCHDLAGWMDSILKKDKVFYLLWASLHSGGTASRMLEARQPQRQNPGGLS